MADLKGLIKNTTAYKMVCLDKQSNRLSHAYMLLTPDKRFIKDYLKIFAKIIVCKDDDFCGKCRECRLIEDEKLTDVKFYPKKDGDKISADDITDIVSDSFTKPYEGDKKLYVITDASLTNPTGQNKLLKTLEEPSDGVHLLIGATSEYVVLPTIKSRVKKLEIPLFSPEDLFNALKGDFADTERLKIAVANCDGTIGGAIRLYEDEGFFKAEDLAKNTLQNLNSSKDVLKISSEILSSGVDIKDFLSALQTILRDMAVYFSDGKLFNANLRAFFDTLTGFNRASCIYALDKITDSLKREFFNNNDTMLIERLLLSILEGKYKWKKL
jgi:DNA polymerase-3 subunit delta'